LAKLAKAAAMSRTTFAVNFKAAVERIQQRIQEDDRLSAESLPGCRPHRIEKEAPNMSLVQIFKAGFALMAILTGFEAFSANQDPYVWVEHDSNFQYQGFTSTYSCDGLAEKLRILLIAAGARADAKATTDGCTGGFGRPDKFARARLRFHTLAPAANAGSASEPVAGVWRSVMFADRSPRDLRLGDCELVEQFRDKVLPMFTTRNVENGMTCVPNQLSGSVIKLNFEVVAAPPAHKK
jgi:hypothetical protein